MTQVLAGQSGIPAIESGQLADNEPFIDIREPEEWARGRAPEARNIPWPALKHRLDELSENRRLVVACRDGTRSAVAVGFLRQRGYDAVCLSGGMLGWFRNARPLRHDGPGCPTVE